MRSLLGYPRIYLFIGTKRRGTLYIGYMIISFVKSGRILSGTLSKFLLADQTRRHTLFSDLAKIMLALNQKQFSRIRSLTLDNNSLIYLKTRPLTLRLQTF
jgi:hypothetical protein